MFVGLYFNIVVFYSLILSALSTTESDGDLLFLDFLTWYIYFLRSAAAVNTSCYF